MSDFRSKCVLNCKHSSLMNCGILLHEDSSLLRCYAVSTGKQFDFWEDHAVFFGVLVGSRLLHDLGNYPPVGTAPHHKDLHFYPYKIQVTHALHERHYVNRVKEHDCDESRTLFEIHAERSQNRHRFCKTLSQQKRLVLQSTAPLQLKRFKVRSKMAIAASAPVLPNQKKQCCKIARFTDASCITVAVSV